ncbi:hypothetical protein BGZ79_006033 [Entomortierella chlamydospora]|nr:hypothetical protein BGZ79_006033 [Entomortierella chlamydospora]
MRRSQLIRDDEDVAALIAEQEEQARAYRKFQQEQESITPELDGEANESVEDTGAESDDELQSVNEQAISVSGRKTPFRGFTPRSEHSINLLNAMLLMSPFDKANGPTVPERRQRVVDTLLESGASKAWNGVLPFPFLLGVTIFWF